MHLGLETHQTMLQRGSLILFQIFSFSFFNHKGEVDHFNLHAINFLILAFEVLHNLTTIVIIST